MRKVFIDCGANDGCSVKHFMEKYSDQDDYEIYSFEGNKSFYDELVKIQRDKFYPSKNLVWTHDGVINFDGWHLGKGTVNKPCIDFSSWIKETFDIDDYIILKMDIEAAEYDVLNKMDKDGSLSYINKFYGELHDTDEGRRNPNPTFFIQKR